VAAPLPTDAAERAWQALAPLRGRHPDARWLPVEKLHLTLAFLGPTAAADVPRLTASVDAVAAAHERFDAATGEGGGRVHDRRDGVCWLRLIEGGRETAQLALDLDEALGSATYDAKHPPHPHLTLARRVDPATLDDVRLTSKGLDIRWTADRIVLFRSYTDPGGSRYEELHSAPLRA
jgi:RNA 2',3'-cyclic 3'-phosphodiesterase